MKRSILVVLIACFFAVSAGYADITADTVPPLPDTANPSVSDSPQETGGHDKILFQLGGNFTLGYPQNEFKDNVDKIGLGGTGYFALNFPRSPLAAGISIGFLTYGKETDERPFSPSIPDVYVDVTTTNDIFLGHLFLRIQPYRGIFLPYVDGLFGLHSFTTETKIKDQDDNDDEEIASTTNLRDTALSYGIGTGLMFRVSAKNKNQGDRKSGEAYIDLGIRYLKGGEAEYLKEGSIEVINGQVNYDISKSVTDILTAHIGLMFTF
jgi:hypothetical protein